MFIKVHDWMLQKWPRNLEMVIVFALVNDMTESGRGFFAGYTKLSEMTGIPKAKCKTAIESLLAVGAIFQSPIRIGGVGRIVWKSNPDFKP